MRFTSAAIFGLILLAVVNAETATETSKPENVENNTETLNDTVPQDLYVIKTIVYEVGILTDATNDTDSNETHEQVDVSFYDPLHNGSAIDLSNIPIPIQTNVSGVTVTGLLPKVDLSSILLPPGSPLLPKKQVTVTQNISTSDPEKASAIISNLPEVLGLTHKEGPDKKVKAEESKDEKEAE